MANKSTLGEPSMKRSARFSPIRRHRAASWSRAHRKRSLRCSAYSETKASAKRPSSGSASPANRAWSCVERSGRRFLQPRTRTGRPMNDRAFSTLAPASGATGLAERFRAVRAATEALAEPLSAEDCAIQSMPDASPVKWHLGHTSWFFETFLLGPYLPGYRVHDTAFRFLFNSYYNAFGDRHPRSRRGL